MRIEATDPQAHDTRQHRRHWNVFVALAKQTAFPEKPAKSGQYRVISFGSFLDDSSAWADLILPDHDTLSPRVLPGISPAQLAPIGCERARPKCNQTQPNARQLEVFD